MDKDGEDAYFDLMPNIELGPDDYRKQDARTGRWHVPDDPKLCRNMFFVGMAVLGFIYWNRDALEAWTLFGVTAMFAFSAGILFHAWLKDVY
jgi:hypothetical protein